MDNAYCDQLSKSRQQTRRGPLLQNPPAKPWLLFTAVQYRTSIRNSGHPLVSATPNLHWYHAPSALEQVERNLLPLLTEGKKW